MRATQSLLLALVMLAPVASYASTPDHLSTEQLVKEHQAAVSRYAANNDKKLPQINEYGYGEKLDIAKVVLLSPDQKVCKVLPRLMTYENSEGELNTVKYQVMGTCAGKN